MAEMVSETIVLVLAYYNLMFKFFDFNPNIDGEHRA